MSAEGMRDAASTTVRFVTDMVVVPVSVDADAEDEIKTAPLVPWSRWCVVVAVMTQR
jgi:hypothetical protein